MLHHVTMECDAVQYWRELLVCGDDVTQAELAFARPLIETGGDSDILARLKHNMAQPLLYWGDNFAVNALSKILEVNIVVVTTNSSTAQTMQYPRTVVMALHNAHYEPLVYSSTGCFLTHSREVQDLLDNKSVTVRN